MQSINKPVAMVLDGGQRASLAIVRSLGRQRIHLISGAPPESTICSASRFCRASFRYTAPTQSISAFLADIKREVARSGADFVIPVTDDTVFVLAKYGADAGLRTLGCPSFEKYQAASDKYNVALLAKEAGLVAPTSKLLGKGERSANIASLIYPVVLKPRWSVLEKEDRITKLPVRIINTPEELDKKLDEFERAGISVIVQELVAGHGAGVFLLCKNGQTLASFCHERVREKPPWGGVSTVSRTITLPHEIIEGAKRLMERFSWDGVAMVEFKWCPNSKKSYIMEVNARYWGSLRLACAAGLDLPYYDYCLATDKTPPIPPSVGEARLRWFLGDLDQLLITLKTDLDPTGRAYDWRRKALSIAEFLGEFTKMPTTDTFDWGDPLPFGREVVDYAQNLLKCHSRQ